MTFITPLSQRIFVRFARKPIWYPTAPSKLFRIAEHTFYSPDEVKDITQMVTAFRAQEESIREFMRQEFYVPATMSGGLPAEFIERESEMDRLLREENDKENARVAELRSEFLKTRLKDLEEKVLDVKIEMEKKLGNITQKVDEYVKERGSDPESFVTPDNIDSKIENAIENPVSFEFFIDIRGKRYASKPKQPKFGQPVADVIGVNITN